MKLFVDDERIAPEGWTLAVTAKQAFNHLETGNVTHLSLDHDLGSAALATGYDIMKWIEYKVETEDFKLPVITFHTANPVGRKNMQATLDAILRRQQS